MTGCPVIRRYLNPVQFERAKKCLKPLVTIVNNSYGEYDFQLRENSFNIYYQGNSLAMVKVNKHGAYSAAIDERFISSEILGRLEPYSESVNKPSQNDRTTITKNKQVRFTINPEKFHLFFQSRHLQSLSAMIRKVGVGEERAFEQVLIAHNPPSEAFIIIDRQIADYAPEFNGQMDLLALKRHPTDQRFCFVVIELKVRRNPELKGKVGSQLNRYVEHIKERISDYAECYVKNYYQKKQLGLFDAFDDNLPPDIEIDEDKSAVTGLVIVGGYSLLGEQALGNLCQKIKENQWDIKVHKMPKNVIRLDDLSDCEQL